MSDIVKIKELRQSTGAGFKDCNLALKESNGDLEKAVEILRIKGVSKASKKMSRDAKEGVIVISESENKLSMIEINCETDFVAKNDDFLLFVKEIGNLNNLNNSNLDKLNEAVMKNNKTVKENLISLIAKIGEKITLGRAKTIEAINSNNYFYQHATIKDNISKLGVILNLDKNGEKRDIDTFGKQLSMHIAASNPLALNIDKLNPDIIAKEQELITEELKNSGKPEDIAKKISLGKLNKFKQENSLLTQDWVMEPKKKVQEIIKDLNLSNEVIKDFARFKIGE